MITAGGLPTQRYASLTTTLDTGLRPMVDNGYDKVLHTESRSPAERPLESGDSSYERRPLPETVLRYSWSLQIRGELTRRLSVAFSGVPFA